MASLSFDEIKRRMYTIKEDIERLKQQRLSPNIRSVLHISNNNIPYIQFPLIKFTELIPFYLIQSKGARKDGPGQ